MSANGGYKIIDLKNKPLSPNVGMVYEGIFESLEETRKTILISGLNLSGKEINDIFVTISYDNNYIIPVPLAVDDGTTVNMYLEITDNDVVTLKISE